MAVRKQEIVESIARKLQFKQSDVKRVLQLCLNEIIETLERERRIELRGFGVFEVVRRSPRIARNPKTGESVSVPARTVVKFRPGKTMANRVSSTEPQPGEAL